MSLTLKQVLDSVVSAIGMLPSTTWVGSLNQADKQVVSLANHAVMALREHRWQDQIRFHTFTTSALSPSYSLPSDYLAMVPDTMWVENSLWKVDMPTDATVWAYLRARSGPTGVVVRARLMRNAIEIWEPADGTPIGYEYYSKNCVFGIDNSSIQPVLAPKEFFTRDDDIHIFDENLLQLEIQWRLKKAKGFSDWSDDRELARRQLGSVLGRDRTAKTIEPALPFDPSPHANLWVNG